MADIAFLLLVFFLVTTTMASDIGLQRKLSEPHDTNINVKNRNVLKVLVNSSGSVMVNGINMEVAEVIQTAFQFVSEASPTTGPETQMISIDVCNANIAKVPGSSWEKKKKAAELLGTYQETKAVISLQTDRSTDYETYIAVQDNLATAIRLLREKLGRERFGTEPSEWTAAQKAALKTAVPQRISEAEPVVR